MTTCSALSTSLGEPLRATAPHARSWLLVEVPDAWGRKAVREAGFGDLEARAKAAGVRVGLVRGVRRRRDSGPRRVLFAHCSAREPFVELLVGPDLDALDLDAPAGGERLANPLYLVCTNGRRDACCARAGGAVARSLRRELDDRVWETSHVGGHRFAANLVALPHGLVFGRLDSASAARVVAAYEEGRIELAAFRGRTTLTPEEQAQEQFVRERTGLVRVDDDLGGYVVEVRGEPLEPPRPTSCGGEPERPIAWRLSSFEPAPST
jgi:sucrase/ferredoxin-like protein